MNPKLVEKLVFPIHEKILRRITTQVLDEISITERMTSKQIQEWQWLLIERLLKHAYNHVPYYKNKFDMHECDPSRINDLQDFRKLPTLTKDNVRNSFNDLVSDNAQRKDLIHASTTGSTGQPLEYYICPRRISYNNAFEIRGRRWVGLNNFDKKVWLWGRRRTQSKSLWMLKAARDYMLNKRLFICDILDEETIKKFLTLLKEYNPAQLYCYAGAIYYISKYIVDNSIDGGRYNIKCIITTAEVLHEYQKDIIEKAFKCLVVQEYGSSDSGMIAHSCEYGRLHINVEGVFVEVEKADQCGFGELIITNLQSYHMPFIRYKIGDVGKLSNEDCPCGRKLPIISKVLGRTMDCLWTKRGKRIDSLVVDTLAEEPGVLRFKIHQKSYDNIVMELVVGDGYNKKFERWFNNEIDKMFDYKVHIDYKYLEKLDNIKHGKTRYITTDIKMNIEGEM